MRHVVAHPPVNWPKADPVTVVLAILVLAALTVATMVWQGHEAAVRQCVRDRAVAGDDRAYAVVELECRR